MERKSGRARKGGVLGRSRDDSVLVTVFQWKILLCRSLFMHVGPLHRSMFTHVPVCLFDSTCSQFECSYRENSILSRSAVIPVFPVGRDSSFPSYQLGG